MVMQMQIDSEYLKNPTDQEAVANAKLTLAIMGLAQEMRYQITLHGISSLGALFCPVFLLCPHELHLACGKFLQSTLTVDSMQRRFQAARWESPKITDTQLSSQD